MREAMLGIVQAPSLLAVFSFLVGLAFGSFGNVLILRLPEGRSIAGRSACPHCGRALRAAELIPIVSFLMLRGRCTTCRRSISWQYPLVELWSGVLFLVALERTFPSPLQFTLLGLSLWLLLLLAVTDARMSVLPDALSIPFLLLAFVRASLLGTPPLLPAVIGGGFFALQWVLSRGAWVGSGDVLLAAGLGVFLGSVPLLLLALVIAYVSGAVLAVVLLLRHRKTLQSPIAFGPFLIAGAVIAFFWGQGVLAAIFGI